MKFDLHFIVQNKNLTHSNRICNYIVYQETKMTLEYRNLEE